MRISNDASRCNLAYTRSKIFRILIQNAHFELRFKLRTLLSCENNHSCFQVISFKYFLLLKHLLSYLSISPLTLSRPISLHSHKPPGPHCFEPFTCNVYRSFQPHNMHMCKQFWGKVCTAKICLWLSNLPLSSLDFCFKMTHELKIEEIFLPWKAKHTGKICSSIDAHVAELPQLASSIDAHVVELPQRDTLYYTLAIALRTHFAWRTLQINVSQKFSIPPTTVSNTSSEITHCFLFRMIPLSTREGLGQKSYGSLSKAFVFVANMRPWSRKECDRPSHKCDNLDRVNIRQKMALFMNSCLWFCNSVMSQYARQEMRPMSFHFHVQGNEFSHTCDSLSSNHGNWNLLI